MTLMKSEYDAAWARAVRMDRPTYRVVVRALRVLFWPLAWPVTRIGAVRRAIGRTIGGRTEAIFRCQRRGEHARAVALALDALKTVRRSPGQTGSQSASGSASRSTKQSNNWESHFHWWQFMFYAVANLEQCDDPEAWDEAMALARNGMEPLQGYTVAYAFLAFARRKMAEGDYDAGTAFAMVAGHADETWGEPEFLLGWCELASGQGNGMAPLSRAVRKDRTILARIADYPTCRSQPDLIATLEEVSKEPPAAGRGDEPSVED